MKVNVGAVEGTSGTVVNVPLILSDIPEGGLTAANFTLAIENSIVGKVVVERGSELEAIGADAQLTISTNVLDSKNLITLLYNDRSGGSSPVVEEGVFC
ncbi:MAG: cohesin domain-containing protein, partial [Clostridia bacterium]|nr:cohesin domain-containing protein [Clostridia bacterium]